MLSPVTQTHFSRHRRDPRLDYAAYSEEAEHLATRIARTASNMANPAWMATKDAYLRTTMTHSRATHFVSFLEYNYSAGDSMANLRACYPAAVEAWELYEQRTREFDSAEERKDSWVAMFSLLDTDFAIVNRMVAMGVLLGWPSLLARLLPIVEYRNPRDAMLEHIFKHYGYIDAITTSECTRHLPYFKTLKVFQATPDVRSVLMKEYLSDWYHASRREPYYDSHKPGREFLGYWAWEAGVITVMLDIDDSSYRNDKFYPADAVAFARQCQQDYAPACLPPSSKTN